MTALPALLLAHHQAAATPFTTVTVNATGTAGFWTSLALVAQGDPHVSYFDLGNGALRYAKRTGGVWSFETVDAGGAVGSYTSIAIDEGARNGTTCPVAERCSVATVSRCDPCFLRGPIGNLHQLVLRKSQPRA